MSFISSTTDARGFHNVIIDGSAHDAKKVFIDGDRVVQLRSARTEESKYPWEGLELGEVVVKDVLIYDTTDLQCLRWFITTKAKIDLSRSYVSPDALEGLVEVCKDLKAKNVQVCEGSSIQIPELNGYSGMDLMSKVSRAVREIGFKHNKIF